MEFRRSVARALHQDHAASLAMLAQLESLLGRHGQGNPPDPGAADVARVLDDVVRAIEAEIGPHFAFEEEAVFPLLAAAGDQEMGELLVAEHRAILPLAERLAALARAAREAGFAADSWAQFHAIGAALAEQLEAHIRKEDMGLLSALDDALDEESDGRLALALAERR